MKNLFSILLLLSSATGQVIQVQGGSSTLLNGTGGGATVYLENSQVYAGYGCAEPGCGFGISQKFRKHKADITVGDNNVSASVDGGGIGMSVRGITVEKITNGQSLAVFVGATGTGFTSPYFQTGKAQHIGAGVSYRRQLGSFTWQGLALLSGGQRSAAASVRYIGPRFGFIGAGGVLQNNPFLNGQIDFAAIKDHLTLSAARQEFYYPDAPSVAANSVSAFGSIGPVSFHGSAIHGTAGRRITNGGSIGAGVRIGPVSIQENYFATAKQRIITTTATETIRRHFIATQTVTGKNQLAFGGGYTSNRLTVSLDHNVLFFPLLGGFQQTTSVQISFRIPRTDAVANFGTYVMPDGQVKWTGYASDFVRGPLQGTAPGQHYASAGRYVIRGRVLDKSGLPVDGAAIALGTATVFSGYDGTFFLRERATKPVALRVMPEDFIAPGIWTVVSAPSIATPGVEPTPVVIVVTK